MTTSSELLTTLAIFKANYDVGKDYLSNFEPFVADALKHWPPGERVTAEPLRRALGERYSLPRIPINTAIALRDRAKQDGLLIQAGKDHVPNRSKLDGLPDLRSSSAEVLARITSVKHALVLYAREVHVLEWADADADEALERFVSEFGVELALARRADSPQSQSAPEEERLAVVYGFSRQASQADPEMFRCLEEMVMGTMLANALYFANHGAWKRDLSHTKVFLDTPLVVRLLGFSPPEVCAAVEELLGLLKSAHAVVRVFRHTLDEICGVLEGVATNLERERRGTLDVSRLGAVNREVFDHLVRSGATASDVREVTSDIERRLLRLGIGVEDMPDYPKRPDFSEQEIEDALGDIIGYRSDAARQKDALSLAGVHILRGAKAPRDVSEAEAIFVTANRGVVTAARRYFKESSAEGRIGHCISETSLTTQLWLRQPSEEGMARKTLIAESVAALNPRREMWERYLTEIERSRQKGQIDDQQVKTLVYSMEARERLIEVTHGAAREIDEETPARVLARYEEEVRRPVEERAESAAAEAERLSRDLAHTRSKEEQREERLQQLEGQVQEATKRAEAADERASRLERLRDQEIENKARRLATWVGRAATGLLLLMLLAALVTGALGLFGVSPVDLPLSIAIPLVAFGGGGLLLSLWLAHRGGSVRTMRAGLEARIVERLRRRRSRVEKQVGDTSGSE